MEAKVEERNLKLAEVYAEIDSILAATLDRDDYVDLETLRIVVNHRPFDRPELEVPVPKPVSIADPPQPLFVGPAEPTGLFRLFRKKSTCRPLRGHKRHINKLLRNGRVNSKICGRAATRP
jgi:restriction system protein